LEDLKKLAYAVATAVSILFWGCSPGRILPERGSPQIDLRGLRASGDGALLKSRDQIARTANVLVHLPDRGFLVGTIRSGSTTLAVLDLVTGALVPVVTKPSSEMDFVLATGRTAYLAREGVDPGKNYVEILDFREGQTRRLKPASGFAILGFILGPGRSDLTYTEMNLPESRSRQAHWRTCVADLETGESRTRLTSRSETRTAEAIPVPFGWSPATGEIYFQGLLPFRAMTHEGIWATSPDGTGLKPLLAETAYTGRPQLSPDGSRLAYLSTNIDSLPADYLRASGSPPGNVLVVMNLITGEKKTFEEKPGAAFGCFRWSAGGNKILAAHREWKDGRFCDRALLAGSEEKSFHLSRTGFSPSPKATVTDLGECDGDPLLWVEKENGDARLRSGSGNGTTLLTVPNGDIRLIGCLKKGTDPTPAELGPGDQ